LPLRWNAGALRIGEARSSSVTRKPNRAVCWPSGSKLVAESLLGQPVRNERELLSIVFEECRKERNVEL
jgi:hypothetical protein